MNRELGMVAALAVCAACGGAPKAAVTTPAGADSAHNAHDGDESAGADGASGSEKPGDSTASGKGGVSGKPASFVVLPHPARSLGRLRALLRGAPAAMPVLDRATAWARNVDLDQPVFAVFEGGGSSATAVGLTPDVAKATRESAQSAQTDCDVVDVAGAARFVCPRGPDGAALKASAASTPPATSADAHMELDAGTIAGFAAQGGGARAALERLAIGSEIRSVGVDLALDGPGEVKVSVALDPKGRWSAGALAAPVAAPPSTFARLPADSELAVFFHAPGAADQGVFKKEILDVIVKEGGECTAQENADARAHFEKVLFTGGSAAVGVGFDRGAAESAAEALVKAPTDKRKQAALRASATAWAVIGVEEPAARWLDNVPWLAKAHCQKEKKQSKVVVVPKPSPRFGLPAGAIEIVERRTKDGAAVSSFTFVVPDKSGGPERTWIAVGDDETVVATRVRAAAKGDSDATLAKRSGIAPLREPATTAGFITAAGISWLFGDLGDPAALVRTANGILRSRSLPTGARTPILFRAETSKAEGRVAARLSLDGAAIGDLASVYGDLGE